MSFIFPFKSYYTFIGKDTRAIFIPSQYISGKAGTTIETTPLWIPPLNTDIIFSPYIPRAKPSSQIITEIPTTFSWAVNAPSRPRLIPNQQDLSPIVDQGLCGSCWCISVITTMTDLFRIQYPQTEANLELSWTYPLACFPTCQSNFDLNCSFQCGGGNPASLCSWLEYNGTCDELDVPNSWCQNNMVCSRFDTIPDMTNLSSYLNQQIPICTSLPAITKRFFLRNPQHWMCTQDMYQDDPLYLEQQSNAIQQHILKKGPVVAGFHVFQEFLGGHFFSSTNPEGVYLEKNLGSYAGSHAVSIVGWGKAKVDDRFIPYWHVKNSWGTQWGDAGFFKIAMYPYNLVSQLDVSVPVPVGDDQVSYSGGIMTFDIAPPPPPPSLSNISSFHPSPSKTSFAPFPILQFIIFILFVILFATFITSRFISSRK